MVALLKISLVLVIASLASAREQRNLQNDRIVNPFVCTPGTNYQLDCNSCTCINGRESACTMKGCLLQPDRCIPGTVFGIRGQLCRCPDCGYKWHSDCFASNNCER